MNVLDRIEERARGLEPRRVLLGAVALPLYAAGWIVGLALRGLWWAGAWAWAALVVGFHEGRAR